MADKKNITNSPEEEKKVEKKATKSKEKKPNIFARAFKKTIKFFKDTVGELKKVVWTSRSEVWKSLQLVIVTVVAVSLAIAVIDFVSSYVINTVAGLVG